MVCLLMSCVWGLLLTTRRPFQDAVHAGSGNIMCSYQRINNSYGCANSKTLNGLLKTELGFQGFVVSDWGAQHTGHAGALAGMDMVMPDPGSFWGDKLVESVKNGSVPESRINDMATRCVVVLSCSLANLLLTFLQNPHYLVSIQTRHQLSKPRFWSTERCYQAT